MFCWGHNALRVHHQVLQRGSRTFDFTVTWQLFIPQPLCEFENQFIFIPICGRCVIKCVKLGKTSYLLCFCKYKNYGIIETNEQFANRCLTVCYSSCLLPVLSGLVSRTEQVFSAITVYCSSWRPLFVK